MQKSYSLYRRIIGVSIVGLVLWQAPVLAHDAAPAHIANEIVLSDDALVYEVDITTRYVDPLKSLQHNGEKPALDQVKASLESFFAETCPVYINELAVEPEVQALSFEDVVEKHLFTEDVPLVIAKIKLAYQLRARADKVSMTWGIYPRKPTTGWEEEFDPEHSPDQLKFEATFYDGEEVLVFRPFDPEHTWHNDIDVEELKIEISAATADVIHQNAIRLPVLSLLIAVVLAVFFISLHYYTINKKTVLIVAISGAVLALLLRNVWLVELAPSDRGPVQELDKQELQSKFAATLENIYHAFSHDDKIDRYKVLARSVDGSVLAPLYVVFNKLLTMKEGSGATSKVDKFELVKFELLGDDEATAGSMNLMVSATWRVDESVAHWQHVHRRTMEYEGDFKLRAVANNNWVIEDVRAKDFTTIAAKTILNEDDDPQVVPERYTMVVTYLGQEIIVDRFSPGYSKAQAHIVDKLLRAEKAPEGFETFRQLVEYATSIQVPGGGASTGGFGDITELGQFTYFSVQYPLREEHRVFVYRAESKPDGNPSTGPYTYFDEFVRDGFYPPSFDFEASGDEVHYVDDMLGHSKTGERIIRRKKVEKK